MRILKLIFLPFIGLGFYTGSAIVAARTGRFPWHPSAKEFGVIAIIHVVLFGLGILLAANSKTKDGGFRFGLSPSGWHVGFVLTYVTGLLLGYFLV